MGYRSIVNNIPGLEKLYSAYNYLDRRRYVSFANYPHTISIELTTRCNSVCTYCPRGDLVNRNIRKIQDMDFKLLEHIIQQIRVSKFEPREISPVGLGEPMLYGDLIPAIRLIKRELPSAYLSLNTNGIHFTKEQQDALISNNVDCLTISLNFHSRDIYIKHCGIGAFDQVCTNIERFLKAKRSNKPKTIIQILDIDDNVRDMVDFKSFWSKRINSNDTISLRPFCDFGGTVAISQYKD